MKTLILILKWALFILGSAIASLIVYNMTKIPRIFISEQVLYSSFWGAWIGWGVVSYVISKKEKELLENFSSVHKATHQSLYFLLYLAVFGVTLLSVFYICNNVIQSPTLPVPENLKMPAVNVPSPTGAGGLGQPVKFDPSMYQPEMHKSDDFDGVLK